VRNLCGTILVGVALLGIGSVAQAAIETLSGNFGDSTNSALVGSDLGAASFTDANTIANNVALYDVTVLVAGTVSIQSTGFGAGGADPYFSLFQGAAGTAIFLASNYTQAYATGGDFTFSGTLAAGNYRLALGVFANESFAENLGIGTLADGFIGLGEAGSLRNGNYAVTLTTPEPVPWPPSGTLMLLGIALVALTRRFHGGDGFA